MEFSSPSTVSFEGLFGWLGAVYSHTVRLLHIVLIGTRMQGCNLLGEGRNMCSLLLDLKLDLHAGVFLQSPLTAQPPADES